MKREVLNLREEQEHLQREVWSLRQRVWNEGPYPIFKIWKREKQKLDEVNLWLLVCSKQGVILKDLIIRFEKLLVHKRGRIPHRGFLTHVYLRENCSVGTEQKACRVLRAELNTYEGATNE